MSFINQDLYIIEVLNVVKSIEQKLDKHIDEYNNDMNELVEHLKPILVKTQGVCSKKRKSINPKKQNSFRISSKNSIKRMSK